MKKLLAVAAVITLVALSGCTATKYTEDYVVEIVDGNECPTLNRGFENCPPLTVAYEGNHYVVPIFTWSKVGEKAVIRCTPELKCFDHTYEAP